MSCALRVNASLFSKRFIARRDAPDLSQSPSSKLLDIGLSRLSSRRGLSPFVLEVVALAKLPHHVLGRTCLALRVDLLPPALWTSCGGGLLANHSPGARDRFRWTLNVGRCRSVYLLINRWRDRFAPFPCSVERTALLAGKRLNQKAFFGGLVCVSMATSSGQSSAAVSRSECSHLEGPQKLLAVALLKILSSANCPS
jgi:hypothetical protein